MLSDNAGGRKDDNGKLRFDLIPVGPLEELANVYTFGASKYADHNWRKGIVYSRIFSAIMRHMWAFWRGEDKDKESGLPHLVHAAWGCFTLLEFLKSRPDLDDRYISYCQCKDERACKRIEDNTWRCVACGKVLK